jgi:hypothetical protein
MAKWSELRASEQAGEIEARVRRYDGVYRWFLIRVEPFRDEMGNVVRWYGVSTDIENLKQTEEKLREDERELRRRQEFVIIQSISGFVAGRRAGLSGIDEKPISLSVTNGQLNRRSS